MSNKLRAGILFLCLVAVLTMTSCGLVVINKNPGGDVSFSTDNASSDTESMVPETEPPKIPVIKNDYSDIQNNYLNTIPDTKYPGSTFKIASPDLYGFSENDSPEYMSKAAAERNALVEEKHEISIVFSYVEYETLFEEVAIAKRAGMYFSDLLMLPQNFIGAFSADDLIINLRSMPELKFDAEYFSSSSVESAAGGFGAYGIAGYGSLSPDSLPAVFFNKDLVGTTGNNLYSLAGNGKWTWDTFFTIGLSSAELTDTFSWATRDLGDSVYDAVFVSCGNKMISSGIMTVPTLGFNAESASPAETVLKTMFADGTTIRTNSKSIDYFKAGLGFFQIDSLSVMSELSTSKANWGVLPLPVVNEGDSYRSLASNDALFFTCPYTVSTPSRSATILMSFNAASVGVMKDAYINYAQFSFLRDNNSANMLDYIIDGAVYDFSYTFGNLYPAIADGTFNIVRGSAQPHTSLNALINYYRYSLETVLGSRFGLSN